YADHGFWAYDVALGVFLKYLIDAAVAAPSLSAQVSTWRAAACTQDIGLTLETDWSDEQRQGFVTLGEDGCPRLAARDSIPAEEIMNWRLLEDERIFLRGAKEVSTAPVVELGHAVIALVTGKLPESPKGEAWFYGTPTGRSTIRMDTR